MTGQTRPAKRHRHLEQRICPPGGSTRRTPGEHGIRAIRYSASATRTRDSAGAPHDEGLHHPWTVKRRDPTPRTGPRGRTSRDGAGVDGRIGRDQGRFGRALRSTRADPHFLTSGCPVGRSSSCRRVASPGEHSRVRVSPCSGNCSAIAMLLVAVGAAGDSHNNARRSGHDLRTTSGR